MGGSLTPPPPRSVKDLPTDIMISVLERLSLADRVRFASSCSSFYSIFRAAQRLRPPKTPPWMLLPSQSTPAAITFFSVSNRRIYRIPQKAEDEEEEEESCRRHRRRRRLLFLGSSDGWLVTLDQGHSQLDLLNPITGAKIHLPPLPSSKLVPLESSKAILSFTSSSASSSPFYTVVLLLARYSNSSAWPTALVCCSSQRAWTPFGRREFYSDAAITSSNIIYTMQSNGTVEAWDLSSSSSGGGPSLSATIVMPKSLSTGFASFTKYLVMAGGGLLQVWRCRDFAKVEFKVFELEEEEEWVEVKSLGGRVVFLNSCCSSMSMMPEDCPPELAGASNSIYFNCLTTTSSSKNRESMVFRMEDGSVESVLLHGSIWEPSPIWIAPTLLGTNCSGGR
ncbi:putative F-box protein [Iris pallida]|uniref:F-box protein n=1 Tax=Iris pallida TaxID=29817 RepID=A0AAX6I5Y6_IRIPA|nr:putative F-box protein [Iris pallida]